MFKIILFLIILITLSTSILNAWIGVLAYYVLAIMGPQYIWWWNFEGLRVSMMVALFTFAGVGVQSLQVGFDSKYFFTRMNFWVLSLYISLVISYIWGPYVGFVSNKIFFTPYTLLIHSGKIVLFYFIATLVMTRIHTIRYLSYLFVITIIYYCYWANNQYFAWHWWQFNWGRLMGPFDLYQGNLYKDENTLALLFVTGLPFLFFYSMELSSRIWRYICWGIILFGWHGIFLTGSRGGLVGLIIVILGCIFKKSRHNTKILKLSLIPVFLIAFAWQAGDLLKERSDTIIGYEGEGSAEMRLTAWAAGYHMIKDHPFTGVGIASFISAFPYYNQESNPRVAHSTPVEFAAEAGLLGGISYVMLIFLFFRQSQKISRWCRLNTNHKEIFSIEFCNNASTVSFLGLSTCSVFLSLNYYEIFYYLLVINNGLFVFCKSNHDEECSVTAKKEGI